MLRILISVLTVFSFVACGDDSATGAAPPTGGAAAGGGGGAPTGGAPSGGGGEGGGGQNEGGAPGVLCADRVGGALITIGNPDGSDDGADEIQLWITSSTFIDEAIEHQANDSWRVALFSEVIPETDCDAEHPWHIEPAMAEWVDLTTERCDATITYVTTNLQDWVARPTPNWCPWGGHVIAVDDRR